MTNTLCIETSGAHCSLALSFRGQRHNIDRHLRRSHNLHLLGLLDDLFAQADAQPQQLDVVGFGCGPGSFTGVRIAAAACQAIALAADAPVVAVPSSLALALSAHQAQPEARGFVCSIKSRGEAYYLSSYVLNRQLDASDTDLPALQLSQDDELTDVPPQWLLHELQHNFAGVGPQPGWWPQQYDMRWLPDFVPRALDCIDWVLQQYAAGAAQPAELALPRYIAGDSPWKKRA